MKKKVIIIIAILLIIIGAIAGVIFIRDAKDKEDKELKKHLTLIEDFSKFEKMIENKEDFILIITGSECPHCEEYLPVFKKVLKQYDLFAYQIEQDKLEPSELGFLKSVATINGTPTVVFIKNGEEESTAHRIVGNRSQTYTIEKLKTAKIIN